MARVNESVFIIFQVVVLLIALWTLPSEGHNKSQPTTNVQNTNGNVNLGGAFETVFAFGDSATDNGNARIMGYLKGFVGRWLQTIGGSAKGSISGSGAASIMGNGLSNGKLVIDHLCDALGVPSVPPFQNHSANFSIGANFALAGATALPETSFIHGNLLSLVWKTVPQSFEIQLQWFNNFMENFKKGGTRPNMNSTLFWLGGVGTSDYFRIRSFDGATSTDLLAKQAIDHIAKLVQGIVNHGAKYIVVQGLPPVGCLPLDLMAATVTERDHTGCAARVNQAVMKHNQLLQQKLGQLQKQFPHCVFVYADFWKAYMKVLSGFQQFGFTEPFKACCGSGDTHYNFNLKTLCGAPKTSVCADATKHMIWDGIHFTAAMYQTIAKLFLQGGCTHPTFEQLIKIKKGGPN